MLPDPSGLDPGGPDYAGGPPLPGFFCETFDLFCSPAEEWARQYYMEQLWAEVTLARTRANFADVDPQTAAYALILLPGSLNNNGEINPNRVRFSQNSCSYYFRDGGNIDDLAAALRSGVTTASGVRPIRLFIQDGKLFTLDNRRMVAFQRAGVDVR